MENLFNSQLYHWISFVLHIFEFISIILIILLFRHNKKFKYYPRLISGGDDKTYKLSQESIKYSNTKYAKCVEFLTKIF